MVAALSWAARLKNGLARTREVLNTPVSELFTQRRVDESLFADLETALLQADCGVAATEWLIASLESAQAEDRGWRSAQASAQGFADRAAFSAGEEARGPRHQALRGDDCR